MIHKTDPDTKIKCSTPWRSDRQRHSHGEKCDGASKWSRLGAILLVAREAAAKGQGEAEVGVLKEGERPGDEGQKPEFREFVGMISRRFW